MPRFLNLFTGSIMGLSALTSVTHDICGQSDGPPSEHLIPGFTAYLDPADASTRVHPRQGILNWSDPETQILWFGRFQQTGSLACAVEVEWNRDGTLALDLRIGDQASSVRINGSKGERRWIDFGSMEIPEKGYQRLALHLQRVPSETLLPDLNVHGLKLSGPAANNAHFNLEPRRNAASVHLMYPVPVSVREVAAFYCEVTAQEDPIHSYYMACGWHRGYFGMQVNSPEERRIIFSVWDNSKEPTDPNKVQNEDRVQLIKKGDGVFTGRFGNEGTGGHSHLKYPWKTGTIQRFLVTASPSDASHTQFSGYYFHPDSQEWMLISSWNTPGEGAYLRGLYSFSENFAGYNGHLLRKARYGNQWIADAKGAWTELTKAKFSHDPTGKSNRLDRYMGLEDGTFFLSHGGFVNGFTEYGTLFERMTTGQQPNWPLN